MSLPPRPGAITYGAVRTYHEVAAILSDRHPDQPLTPSEVYAIERRALRKLRQHLQHHHREATECP